MTPRTTPRYYVPLLRSDGELAEPIVEFKYKNTARTYAIYMMTKPQCQAAVLVEWSGDGSPLATFAWSKAPDWTQWN